MSTPLHFSAEEPSLLLALAQPIPAAQRSAFLDAVAAAIGGQASGPGLCHQVGKRIQREFWDPPLSTVVGTPQRRGERERA